MVSVLSRMDELGKMIGYGNSKKENIPGTIQCYVSFTITLDKLIVFVAFTLEVSHPIVTVQVPNINVCNKNVI